MDLQIQLDEALALNEKLAWQVEQLEHYHQHPESGVNCADD
jgi:hypothetical protein